LFAAHSLSWRSHITLPSTRRRRRIQQSKVLGTILKHVDDNTYVFIVSDHGIKPLREFEEMDPHAHMDHEKTTPVIAKHDFADGDDVPGSFFAMGPGIKHGLRLMACTRPFYEAVAAISVAGEAQFGDMAETYARTGETRYGLSPEATAFWWVHAKADKEHGGTAFEIVSHWARTDEEQQQVIESVRQSLELAWCWFDGFVRATA